MVTMTRVRAVGETAPPASKAAVEQPTPLKRSLRAEVATQRHGRDRMRIGVPREVKRHEYRVALTPAGVNELVRSGHDVAIEQDAGAGSSIADEVYQQAGARILPTADAVWDWAELVLKVKEPIAEEYPRMQAGQVLFCYLHLAASRECTDALIRSRITAIAYETVQLGDRSLPLLAPMSEVAGRMAPQVGARCLERESGGRGVLLGGVPGVAPANVVVLGAGVAGMSAAAIAVGMHANVTLLDNNVEKLRHADRLYEGRLRTVASNTYEVESACVDADLVIGAVLVAGAKAPSLVSDRIVAQMKSGAVLVDIAVDQGGCFESSRPTTHDDPTYKVHDTSFYCVANMPGAVPHTSTYALTNVTLPYISAVADAGWREACRTNRSLAWGLSVHDGQVTSQPVAEAHELDSTNLHELLMTI
jgi:alanine dehydrogenase